MAAVRYNHSLGDMEMNPIMVSVVVTNISFNRSVKLHVVFGLLIGNVYRPIKEFWGEHDWDCCGSRDL